jgi:hypothetical protein
MGCEIFAYAETRYYPPSISQFGSITLPKTSKRPGYTTSMSEDTGEQCRWRGDCLTLTLKNEGATETLIRKQIESSYGRFQLYLADLTADGVEEILLITGEGRGTSARQESLTVYRRTQSDVNEILRVPISEYFGSGKRWWYEVQFHLDPRLNMVLLSLHLNHDTWESDDTLVVPDLIPKERDIAYKWNESSQALLRIK